MMGIIACISAAAVGVDYGWQPVAGGGIEYIIQIETQRLDRLKAGEDVFSDLPPYAGNIRGYRITVGTAKLPHQGQPPPSARDLQLATSSAGQTAEVSTPPRLDGPLPGPVPGPRFIFDDPVADQAAPPPLRQPEAVKRLATKPAGFENDEPSDAETGLKPHAPPNSIAAKTRDVGKQSHEVRRAAVPDRSSAKVKSSGPDDGAATTGDSDRQASASSGAAPVQPARPTLAVFGLFASLGVNAFLLWVASSQRTRYRALAKAVSRA